MKNRHAFQNLIEMIKMSIKQIMRHTQLVHE